MLCNAILYSYIYHFAMYFQNKYYPKDSAKDALCKGRVRVQLKQSDASFVNEKFQSSKLIYKLSVHHMTVLNAVVLYYYWLNFHYLSFQLYMYNHSLQTKEKNILYFEWNNDTYILLQIFFSILKLIIFCLMKYQNIKAKMFFPYSKT